jgi:pimeloyl-ACP methyl ester carboxylesterase
MPIARVRGIDIHYEITGDSGPFVLLVMGLGARGENWTPIARALAGRGYRTIQFDNRDVGRSTKSFDADYEIADMAADAIGLLDELGVEKAHVIGISMGGMISQELLVRHPERFTRAVLMATWPGGELATMPEAAMLESLSAMADHGDPARDGDALRALYRSMTGPSFAEKNPEMLEMAVSFALENPPPPESLRRQLRAIGGFSIWDRLPDVRTPALILHGDADRLIPYDNGVMLSRRIPGASLRTLPGVGHLVPLEAPFEAFGMILDFLA